MEGAKVFKVGSEKDYYFSYENVRQRLRESRRVGGVEHYRGVTVLDMLSKMFNKEEIGIDAYDEVEWRAFGITVEKIEKMAKIIEKPDEITRVFTYMSDHADDVLPEDSSLEEIENFELACDSLVSQVIEGKCPFIMDTYEEPRIYLRMIGANVNIRTKIDEQGQIIYKHMWKQANYDYTNLFPFETVCCAGQSALIDIIFNTLGMPEDRVREGDIPLPELENYFPKIHSRLSLIAYRPIRDHKEPMIQSLYIMSVYARDHAINSEPTNNYLLKISDKINDYVWKQYQVNIADSVNDAVAELQEQSKDATNETVEKPSDKPDGSFFTCSNEYPYAVCEKQLMQDINEATSKLDACRRIRSSTLAGYFQLQGKTNEEKAQLINPWVAYTNKRYNFVGDDFRKAKSIQRKR